VKKRGLNWYSEKIMRWLKVNGTVPRKEIQGTRPFLSAVKDTLDTPPPPYERDGLMSIHNHEFERDAFFVAAYNRGIKAVADDYNWHWRVHIALWGAYTAGRLAGDFVECGVNKGFMSSAIMHFLDWDSTGKMFYLLDTFCGIETKYLKPSEVAEGYIEQNRERLENNFYTDNLQDVMANFSEWKNLKIIPGPVPDTLPGIDSGCIAFVHLDMNCATPEVAAVEYLWDKIVTGGIILFDDYAYSGYRNQKLELDRFAHAKRIAIASLPTGQGLIVRN
jgi:hypothetical protein